MFYTLSEYLSKNSDDSSLTPLNSPLIILRHDVEARYENALRFAEIQHHLGIHGSYYFRLFPKPGNTEIIKKIADLDHEIGYHYDDLSYCKGDYEKVITRFQQNLAFLREIAPVQTICMEGAPGSKYNNQDLWEKYDYHDFGITSEPYFDLDFNAIYYLTDTGRRWDGKFSVRDKPFWGQGEKETKRQGDKETKRQGEEYMKLRFRHTRDIVKAVEEGSFPNQAMLTFHPQRWNDKPWSWLKELVWQNVKNQGKRFLLKLRG
ncbi:MAG: hypothetical protein RBR35_01380 [Salinivirgaceae bacterium]|nr:hypothetical protein [Salinivirgaceae bacterium]